MYSSSDELIHKICSQAHLLIMFPRQLDLTKDILYLFCLPIRVHILASIVSTYLNSREDLHHC